MFWMTSILLWVCHQECGARVQGAYKYHQLQCTYQMAPFLFALACKFLKPNFQGWMDTASLSSSPEAGCSWDMGSEGPTEPDPEVEENSRLQSQKLWAAETNMRMMVNLTAIEKEELLKRFQTLYPQGEMVLVANLFGRPDTRAMTKMVYQRVLHDMGGHWDRGEAFSSILCDFTLGKSLLLSGRAAGNNVPEGQDPCYCFPRTSLMPLGCVHKPVALGETPWSSKRQPWHCSQCSLCLRCWRNFGCNTNHSRKVHPS